MQAPWSTGTECIAKYNFQTANEQDLPFCKGDVLTIIGVTRVSMLAALRVVRSLKAAAKAKWFLFKERLKNESLKSFLIKLLFIVIYD